MVELVFELPNEPVTAAAPALFVGELPLFPLDVTLPLWLAPPDPGAGVGPPPDKTLTPLLIVAVVTQFDELGIEATAVGVTRSPTV